MLDKGDEHDENHANHNRHYDNDHARVDGEQGRVTKTITNQINHAKCIMKLTFAKFDWSEKALLSFHRPNIQEAFDQVKYEQEQMMEEERQNPYMQGGNS